MNKSKLILLCFFLSSIYINAQDNSFHLFSPLIGEWSGSGQGFSGGVSQIESSFQPALDNKYFEVRNQSRFQPSEKHPEGEFHQDWGMISYEKSRQKYIFRQFHNEGYVIQYILDDSLSNSTSLVFISEVIDNFVPGGRARYTINLIGENQIETLFDVSFGQEYSCFGKNSLRKKE